MSEQKSNAWYHIRLENLLKQDRLPQLYVIATGAGAGIQNLLWQIPGISRSLLGASFPYGNHEMTTLLGYLPERSCTPEVAMDLAIQAYLRACRDPSRPACGLALTASVASTLPHRGEHRVNIAALDDRGAFALDFTLDKRSGWLARHLDGEIADKAALDLLLHMCEDIVLEEAQEATQLLEQQFFARPYFGEHDRLKLSEIKSQSIAFLPGTFNPPHQGHMGMATEWEKATYRDYVFWITANPPHKPSLTIPEMLRRRLSIPYDVLFTRGTPLFLDKARLFPGSTFLIGADTMQRMLDPRWGPEIEPMLRELIDLKIHFWVNRRWWDGQLLDAKTVLEEAHLPYWAQALFVPRDAHWEISSSQLRGE